MDNLKKTLSKSGKEIDELKRDYYFHHSNTLEKVSNQYKNIRDFYIKIETEEYEELNKYLYDFLLLLYY